MSWLRGTRFFDAVFETDRGVVSDGNSYRYEVLEERLRTYILPPAWKGTLCFQLMANAGFVYTGQEDLVFCFSCNVELDGWTKYMDPLLRHKEESRTCSFVKQLRKRRRKDKLVTTPLEILPTPTAEYYKPLLLPSPQ